MSRGKDLGMSQPAHNPNEVTAEEAQFMSLNRLPTGITPLTVQSNMLVSGRPLLLDNITRDPLEWKLLDQVPTEEVPNWFDAQVNVTYTLLTLLMNVN